MNFSTSFQLTAPELILVIGGILLTLVAAFGGDRTARAVAIAAVAVFVAAAAPILEYMSNPALSLGADTFGGVYRMDGFANFTKLLIIAAAVMCLMVTPQFFAKMGENRPEYSILLLFNVVGMGLMVSAVDLMTLYIGVELSALSSYVLASFLRSDERSAEAGLKYFVLGALASGILLFGMSFVYGFSGTTSYLAIRPALDGTLGNGALLGIILVFAGLAFKISAVPFHMWTPDVYEGAPTPVTMFFSTAPKVAAVALTMRIMLDAFGTQIDVWQQIVIFVALASIILGALGAIGQTNIKRLLAYSSINNIGFILIGLAAATVAGASAMLVYLAIYVAMSVGSFVAVLMMKDSDGNQLEGISDLAGLSSTRPLLALAMAIMMLSLAGIPPLFGFWGKFVVFQAAVQADLIVLAAIGIAASVIGAFYYIKIVKIMYFDEPAGTVTGKSDWAHGLVLAVTALFVSPLGYLLTIWLNDLAGAAASALFLTA